jgi:hypothetical protein
MLRTSVPFIKVSDADPDPVIAALGVEIQGPDPDEQRVNGRLCGVDDLDRRAIGGHVDAV